VPHGSERVKESVDMQSGFTPSRKVRKGREAKKGLCLRVSSRLCDFAWAVLIFSHVLTPWARPRRPYRVY
jgi:hypothetical protein